MPIMLILAANFVQLLKNKSHAYFEMNQIFDVQSSCFHNLPNCCSTPFQFGFLICFLLLARGWLKVHQVSAPDLGAQGAGARAQVPPPKWGPQHVHVFSHMYDMCVPLSHFYERGRFADAIKLSVVQTAVLHFHIIWYCVNTTITLIVFLKVGQVSQSCQCKVKPCRTH